MKIMAPTPEAITAAQDILAIPKMWVAGDEIAWRDAGGMPKGYSFRGVLETAAGYQPAGLFVDLYYKPTRIPNTRDKLSMSLLLNGSRILGVDDNGPTMHRNDVGAGRPFYMQHVAHPHLHTISIDGLEGYAEPLRGMTHEELWTHFLQSANILNAPPFVLPSRQLDLPRL